jgi:hypothetical protein
MNKVKLLSGLKSKAYHLVSVNCGRTIFILQRQVHGKQLTSNYKTIIMQLTTTTTTTTITTTTITANGPTAKFEPWSFPRHSSIPPVQRPSSPSSHTKHPKHHPPFHLSLFLALCRRSVGRPAIVLFRFSI